MTVIELRKLTLSDASAVAWLPGDDPEDVAGTARIPWRFTLADAREWLEKANGTQGALALLRNGEFTGCAGLHISAFEAEAGYWIGKPFRNSGLASEAVRLPVLKAREEGLHRTTAYTFTDNAVSIRVLEKHGFRKGGEADKDVPLPGGLRRVFLFALDLEQPA